ncbi:MAG: helix-turn-helix domain-containing protein [bacterium]|nr:helix-turn-helix domain-containing protein [bacterium]
MEDQQLILSFGNTLKSVREERSLSQEKLALNVGLHPTYISLLERGKRQPSLTVIFKLAKELGYSASKFVELVERGVK